MSFSEHDSILLIRSILEACYQGKKPEELIEDVYTSSSLTFNEKALAKLMIRETARLIYTGMVMSSLGDMVHDKQRVN
mgnify:CR=1 FL=1